MSPKTRPGRSDRHDTNLLIYSKDVHTPKPGNGDVTVNITSNENKKESVIRKKKKLLNDYYNFFLFLILQFVYINLYINFINKTYERYENRTSKSNYFEIYFQISKCFQIS